MNTSLPPLRFDTVEAGQEFGPVHLHVRADYVDRFRFALGTDPDLGVETSRRAAPPLLLGNELLFLPFTKFDRDSSIALHTYQHLSWHRPIRAGDEVILSGRYTEKFVKRGRGYIRLEAEARTPDKELVIRHESLEMVEAVGALEGRGSAGGKRDWTVTGKMAPVPPIAYARPGVEHRTPLRPLVRRITQPQINVFSWGDRGFANSHTDLEIARAKLGADSTLIQALHQAALVAELAHGFFGDSLLTTGEMEMKFIAPCYSDRTLKVEAVVVDELMTRGGAGCRLDVWVTSVEDRERTAVGRVSAAYGAERKEA